MTWVGAIVVYVEILISSGRFRIFETILREFPKYAHLGENTIDRPSIDEFAELCRQCLHFLFALFGSGDFEGKSQLELDVFLIFSAN